VLVLVTNDGEAFNGAFLVRPLRPLHEGAGADRFDHRDGDDRRPCQGQRIDKFEYPVLIVLATLGMLLMISANDMIALYMGLELQSLSLYVVAAINRDSVRSTEAGLKYFVLGALSSGMLLYGMSLVYGFTGHTGFAEIAKCDCRRGRVARPDLRTGVPACRYRLQDFRRAVPHVDARCL
jgi:NADH-quinone oxidoreductase subunit N